MGLCAALARDRALEVLDGAVPELAAAARAAADALLEGPAEGLDRRVSAEVSSLLERTRIQALQRSWPSAPSAERLLPGVRHALLAWLSQHGPPSPIPATLAPLAGDAVYRHLTRLSSVVVARAAAGEGWAAFIATLGVRECRDVNPRLAPAVAWIALAFLDDEASGDGLASVWPLPLAGALERCRRSPLLGGSRAGESARISRARLDEELEHRG